MAVNQAGAVYPSSPGGFYSAETGIDAWRGVDENNDNITDWIDTASGGNNIFDFNAAGLPDGTGSSGLEWDDDSIWADYDYDFPIEVGCEAPGWLQINGGSAVRPEHVEVGTRRYGVGNLEVTGFGSHLTNYQEDIPAVFRVAIDMARTKTSHNPKNITFSQLPRTSTGGTKRSTSAAFNMYVGRYGGTGTVDINSGGLVGVGNQLIIANDEASGIPSSGTVSVDGSGSVLYARGRSGGKSIIGEGGRLIFSNGGTGAFHAEEGLEIRGLLEADSEGLATLIQGNVTLIAEGAIRVRPNTTLIIGGNFTNDGEVILDPGAHLQVVGTTSGGGNLRRPLCGNTTVAEAIVDDNRAVADTLVGDSITTE